MPWSAPRLMCLKVTQYIPYQHFSDYGDKGDVYRISPTVETSNLSAMACPNLPPRNLI
jgi:hypothetical protein